MIKNLMRPNDMVCIRVEEYEGLKNQLRDAEDEIAYLREDRDAYINDLNIEKQKVKQLETRVKATEIDLGRARNTIILLRNENVVLLQEKEVLKENCDDCCRKTCHVVKYVPRGVEVDGRAYYNEEQYRKVENKLNETINKYNNLLGHMGEKNRIIDEANSKLIGKDEEIRALREKIDEITEYSKETNDEVAELEKEIHRLKAANEHLQWLNDGRAGAISGLEDANKILHCDIFDLRAENAELKRRNANQFAEIVELRNKVEELEKYRIKRQLNDVFGSKSVLEAQLKRVTESLKETEQTMKHLNRALTEYQLLGFSADELADVLHECKYSKDMQLNLDLCRILNYESCERLCQFDKHNYRDEVKKLGD